MSKKDSKDLATGGFLSFSLMAQEIIVVMFAFYSYRQGEMGLATFYLAIAGILIVALGVFYIFDKHRLARLLLASTLFLGFLFLLLGASDATSLMWCLTIVPVLVGAFDHRQSLAMLVALFAAATWIMCGGHLDHVWRRYAVCSARLQRYCGSAISLVLCHFGRLRRGHGQLSLRQPDQVQGSLLASR